MTCQPHNLLNETKNFFKKKKNYSSKFNKYIYDLILYVNFINLNIYYTNNEQR